MRKFILIGPNAGKTVTLGGFAFTDGVCEVSEADAEKGTAFLAEYHSAYPQELAADKQAEYDRVQAELALAHEQRVQAERDARRKQLEKELASLQ